MTSTCLFCASEHLTDSLNEIPRHSKPLATAIKAIWRHLLQFPNNPYDECSCFDTLSCCPSCQDQVDQVIRFQTEVEVLKLKIGYAIEQIGEVVRAVPPDTFIGDGVEMFTLEGFHRIVAKNYENGSLPSTSVRLKTVELEPAFPAVYYDEREVGLDEGCLEPPSLEELELMDAEARNVEGVFGDATDDDMNDLRVVDIRGSPVSAVVFVQSANRYDDDEMDIDYIVNNNEALKDYYERRVDGSMSCKICCFTITANTEMNGKSLESAVLAHIITLHSKEIQETRVNLEDETSVESGSRSPRSSTTSPKLVICEDNDGPDTTSGVKFKAKRLFDQNTGPVDTQPDVKNCPRCDFSVAFDSKISKERTDAAHKLDYHYFTEHSPVVTGTLKNAQGQDCYKCPTCPFLAVVKPGSTKYHPSISLRHARLRLSKHVMRKHDIANVSTRVDTPPRQNETIKPVDVASPPAIKCSPKTHSVKLEEFGEVQTVLDADGFVCFQCPDSCCHFRVKIVYESGTPPFKCREKAYKTVYDHFHSTHTNPRPAITISPVPVVKEENKATVKQESALNQKEIKLKNDTFYCPECVFKAKVKSSPKKTKKQSLGIARGAVVRHFTRIHKQKATVPQTVTLTSVSDRESLECQIPDCNFSVEINNVSLDEAARALQTHVAKFHPGVAVDSDSNLQPTNDSDWLDLNEYNVSVPRKRYKRAISPDIADTSWKPTGATNPKPKKVNGVRRGRKRKYEVDGPLFDVNDPGLENMLTSETSRNCWEIYRRNTASYKTWNVPSSSSKHSKLNVSQDELGAWDDDLVDVNILVNWLTNLSSRR